MHFLMHSCILNQNFECTDNIDYEAKGFASTLLFVKIIERMVYIVVDNVLLLPKEG